MYQLNKINKCSHVWFYTVIIVLIFATLASLFVAIRNSKPICTDLVRFGDSLTCVYDLGDIQEDEADVIIIK